MTRCQQSIQMLRERLPAVLFFAAQCVVMTCFPLLVVTAWLSKWAHESAADNAAETAEQQTPAAAGRGERAHHPWNLPHAVGCQVGVL